MPRLPALMLALSVLSPASALAQEPPSLSIVWPPAGTTLQLSGDPDGAVGVVVRSNFALKAAGTCGTDPRCGHVHMRIDPEGTSCFVAPDKPYNSMNSDVGGDLIKARFGFCAQPLGPHVIGVLLADDHHQPVLVDGKPVTALVPVTTVAAP